NGIGYYKRIDEELVIPNKALSISEGALVPYNTSNKSGYYYQIFKIIAENNGFDMDTPIKDAPKEFMDELLYGTDKELEFNFVSHYTGDKTYKGTFEGVINNLE